MSNCSARTATSSMLPDRATMARSGRHKRILSPFFQAEHRIRSLELRKIHSTANGTALTADRSAGEQDLHRPGGEDGHTGDGGQDEQGAGTHSGLILAPPGA